MTREFGADLTAALLHQRATLRLEVKKRDRSHWHLILTIATPSATTIRELDGANCAELVDAAGLLLAIAVDPAVPEEPPRPVRVPVLLQAGDSEIPFAPKNDAPQARATPSPHDPNKHRFAFGIGPTIDAWILPMPSYDFTVDGYYAITKLVRAGLSIGGALVQSSSTVVNQPGTTVHSEVLVSVHPQACYSPEFGELAFGVCGGMRAAVLDVQVTGNAISADRRAPIFSLSAGPTIDWRASLWLGMRLDMNVMFTPTHTHFSATSTNGNTFTLFDVPPVSMAFRLAVEIWF